MACGIVSILLLMLLVRDYRDSGFVAFHYLFPAGILFGFALALFVSATRFSLRTLLIATTLVAVVLGLAVYAARR